MRAVRVQPDGIGWISPTSWQPKHSKGGDPACQAERLVTVTRGQGGRHLGPFWALALRCYLNVNKKHRDLLPREGKAVKQMDMGRVHNNCLGKLGYQDPLDSSLPWEWLHFAKKQHHLCPFWTLKCDDMGWCPLSAKVTAKFK